MPAADGQLTAAEVAAIYALVRAQAVVRDQLAQIAVAGALAPLRLVNWYSSADLAEAVERVLRIVQPVQLRMAQITDAYLARALTTMTGRPVRPVGTVDIRQLRRVASPAVARVVASRAPSEIKPEGDLDLERIFRLQDEQERRRQEAEDRALERQYAAEDRRLEREQAAEDRRLARELAAEERRIAREQAAEDRRLERERSEEDRRDAEREARLLALDPMEPYMRIGGEYRYLISEGTSEEEARRRALGRVEAVADTDVSLAQRAQEREVLRQQDPGEIKGYRRVLFAEMRGDSPPCGLCVVAADRIYRREDLKPIHLHCRCGVLPIRGTADPGLQLNGDDLERIYTAAGSTGGQDLRAVRVAVTEHGEIGPILIPYGKGFRDAEEADADRREGSIRRRLQGLERSTAALERQLADGNARLRPLVGYQQRLVAQLREQLAA